MPSRQLSSVGKDLRLRAAAFFWIGCLQYFVLEAICTFGFAGHYSYRTNYMSDLGAVHCGQVCSHWHALMNVSFFLQGLLITGGVFLLPRRITPGLTGFAARILLLLSAAGVIVVSLTPEDVNRRVHVHGALFNFVGSGIGLLLLGFALLPVRRSLGWTVMLGGAVSLVGDMFFVFPSPYLNAVVGTGLLERIAAYPLPLCLACVGLWLLCGSRV